MFLLVSSARVVIPRGRPFPGEEIFQLFCQELGEEIVWRWLRRKGYEDSQIRWPIVTVSIILKLISNVFFQLVTYYHLFDDFRLLVDYKIQFGRF